NAAHGERAIRRLPHDHALQELTLQVHRDHPVVVDHDLESFSFAGGLRPKGCREGLLLFRSRRAQLPGLGGDEGAQAPHGRQLVVGGADWSVRAADGDSDSRESEEDHSGDPDSAFHGCFSRVKGSEVERGIVARWTEFPVEAVRGSDPAVRQAALFQVLLVVVLGPVESRGRLDRGDDRAAVLSALFESVFRFSRGSLLLGRVKEDDRTVLLADVGALAVPRRGIVVLPEDLEKLLVRDLRGVVVHLDRLGVARRSGADVLVGRVLRPPALVADRGCENPLDLPEGRLDAPEASPRAACFGHVASTTLSFARGYSAACPRATGARRT